MGELLEAKVQATRGLRWSDGLVKATANRRQHHVTRITAAARSLRADADDHKATRNLTHWRWPRWN